jgi:hypothetical protein
MESICSSKTSRCLHILVYGVTTQKTVLFICTFVRSSYQTGFRKINLTLRFTTDCIIRYREYVPSQYRHVSLSLDRRANCFAYPFSWRTRTSGLFTKDALWAILMVKKIKIEGPVSTVFSKVSQIMFWHIVDPQYAVWQPDGNMFLHNCAA